MKTQLLSFTGITVALMLFYLVPAANTTSVSLSEATNAIEESSSSNYYVEMPNGHQDWTQEKFEKFIDNLTPEIETALIKSHQVKSYLEHINKYDDVVNDMAKGSLFSEVDLSKYLTEKQMVNMAYFDYVETDNNSAAFNCNIMVSCRSAGTACTANTRYIQRWYRCTSFGGYYYEVCRSSCGGPR